MQNSQSAPSHPNTPGVSIDLAMLWRGKWRIAICVLAFLGLGWAYLNLPGRLQMIEARILVEDRGLQLATERPTLRARDLLPTQVEVISSPTVIAKALESLPPAAVEMPTETRVRDVLDRLDVQPLVGTDVLSLRFEDESAAVAIRTVQAIIDSYREYLQLREQQGVDETVRLLADREEELRKQIQDMQKEHQKLRTESPLRGMTRAEADIRRTKLTQLDTLLAETRNRRLRLETYLEPASTPAKVEAYVGNPPSLAVVSDETDDPEQLAMFQEAGAGQGSEDISPAAVNVLSRLVSEGWIDLRDPAEIQAELDAAQAKEVELCQRLGPKHPDLRALREQIATLQSQLESLTEAVPAALRRELQQTMRQEEQLDKLYAQESLMAHEADAFVLKEEQHTTELARVQSEYDAISAQLQQQRLVARSISAGESSVSVRLLDGPSVLMDAVAASPKVVVALCGMMGLLFGAVWVGLSQRRPAPTEQASL